MSQKGVNWFKGGQQHDGKKCFWFEVQPMMCEKSSNSELKALRFDLTKCKDGEKFPSCCFPLDNSWWCLIYFIQFLMSCGVCGMFTGNA